MAQGRLLLAPDANETVTVTSFTLAETHAGELFALLAEDEAAFRAKTTATHNAYLERTIQAARDGAEIVMWPELAGFGLEADVLALIERGQTIAREEGIYLAMPVSRSSPTGTARSKTNCTSPIPMVRS